MKIQDIPQSVRICLWSYDIDRMDFTLADDRFKLIFNVLNYGTSESTNWLMKNFSKQEIREVINQTIKSEWNKKSLSLWSLVFQSFPSRQTRFI